jgi:hypothetical protein
MVIAVPLMAMVLLGVTANDAARSSAPGVNATVQCGSSQEAPVRRWVHAS